MNRIERALNRTVNAAAYAFAGFLILAVVAWILIFAVTLVRDAIAA